MNQTQQTEEQLITLATYIAAQRPVILKAWHDAVHSDSALSTALLLPRSQFYDRIPDVLDAFTRKLHVQRESAASEAELKSDAAAHGLQRWQQGYHLREVTREWARLQTCLADVLQGYASAHPELSSRTISTAWRALAELCAEGVSESTAQYFEVQQKEAVGQVNDLNGALEQMRELEGQRAELWRQAAHDLRGNLSLVVNATAGLTREGVSDLIRDRFLDVLKKNMSALHTMLDDVMNLARLQAGLEERDIKPFDAAVVLKDLCENLQAFASEHGLFLNVEGPGALGVEGDAGKVRRIVQNLLLNALKYTQQGGVTVSWGDSRKDDTERWMLCVQDTGPGLRAGPGAPVTSALQDATDEARHLAQKARETPSTHEVAAPAVSSESVPDARPIHREQGEGIGLSIVKRLCELLDASLELESEPDQGTVIRVVFPRHYSATR
jgi:signal transduction histidine kinase